MVSLACDFRHGNNAVVGSGGVGIDLTHVVSVLLQLDVLLAHHVPACTCARYSAGAPGKVSGERPANATLNGDSFVNSIMKDSKQRNSTRTHLNSTENRLEVVSSFTRSIKRLQRYENIPHAQQMQGVIRMKRKNTHGVIQNSGVLKKNYDFDEADAVRPKEARVLRFNLTLPSPVTGEQEVSPVGCHARE